MRNRSTLATAAVSILVVSTLAACGSSTARPQAGQAAAKTKDVTLMLNWYPYGEHAALYYGQKQGIYKKHGINLTIRAGQGSTKTVQAVGANQVDVGWADTPALMSAISKGVPAMSVGVFLQTTPSSVEFFSTANIKTPQDLKGHTIATTTGDALSATFPAYLKANGLTVADVKLENVDAAGKIAAVMSGRTDALLGFAHDQGPIIAEKSGKQVNYLRFADGGINFLSNGLIVSKSTLAKDRPLVDQMVAATREAFTEAVKHPDEAVASMKGSSPQLPSDAVLKHSWAETVKILFTDATKGKDPGVNAESDWQHTIDVFANAGTLMNPGKPSDYWVDIPAKG